MSKTEVKKHLLSLTKEQVIEQVLGLYDTRQPISSCTKVPAKAQPVGTFSTK